MTEFWIGVTAGVVTTFAVMSVAIWVVVRDLFGPA